MSRFPKHARDVTSKTIDGVSDLVIWAPIKDGFIDAFANTSYETRLRQVAEALHSLRQNVREYEHVEFFSDTAKRILTLLDFRIGIVDRDIYASNVSGDEKRSAAAGRQEDPRPRKYMYLVATFDSPWEPYIRLIWKPLGTFLDLILCNCEGYTHAVASDFEEYSKWVRDHQLDSAIFYSTSGLTVPDKIYLSELEYVQRKLTPEQSDHLIAGMTSETPEEEAKKARKKNAVAALRLALEAANVLYKLTDLYPADAVETGQDGTILLRAAKSLLDDYEFEYLCKNGPIPPGIPEDVFKELRKKLRKAYGEQLAWLTQELPWDGQQRKPDPAAEDSEVQKGLLTSYDIPRQTPDKPLICTQGALLLMRVDNVELAKFLLRQFPWSWEKSERTARSTYLNLVWNAVFRNIYFTHEGLKRFGFTDEELLQFPKEFRQGLSERATLVGDEFDNHPRRWTLPKRWTTEAPDGFLPPVELSEVDLAIHFRTGLSTKQVQLLDGFVELVSEAQSIISADGFERVEKEFLDAFETQYGLNDIGMDSDEPQTGAFDQLIERLEELKGSAAPNDNPLFAGIVMVSSLAKKYGLTLLSAQEMNRGGVLEPLSEEQSFAEPNQTTRDHFDFRDGISQPNRIPSSEETKNPTDVYRGDILFGYRSTRGDYHKCKWKDGLLFNGSFLVVRKMSQDVAAFQRLLKDNPELKDGARLVGRKRNGDPLVDPGNTENEFNYRDDTKGKACPLSAHIRLSHPRSSFHGRKDPMILRRGMSYGKRFDNAPGEERGVMFMAFCSSLAEQYEVIQRWLNSGNATGISSSQNDPLTGVFPPGGKPKIMRFLDCEKRDDDGDGEVEETCTVPRVIIDKPFVKLEWGHYFFCPSKTALGKILKPGPKVPEQDTRRIEEGEAIIAELERLPAAIQQAEWKKLLEDFLSKDPEKHDITPRVFEAIQARGGAYRIEAGVAFDEAGDGGKTPVILVTDPEEILHVYKNEVDLLSDGTPADGCPYSSATQKDRFDSVFRTIYVTLDNPEPGPDGDKSQYEKEAYPTNSILLGFGRKEAINDGYDAGKAVLGEQKRLAEFIAANLGIEPSFKIELSRQYVALALSQLCEKWFGIPDTPPDDNESNAAFKGGGWTWRDKTGKPEDVQAACPGDFLSASRFAFYPRPTSSIKSYAELHGSYLRVAVDKLIDRHWGTANYLEGKIARKMQKALQDLADKETSQEGKDFYKVLLGRNLIGNMIGALPPMDANLRFTFYDWLEKENLWRIQHELLRAKKANTTEEWAETIEKTLTRPLTKAMSIRPAPDLLYRTVRCDKAAIGNVVARKGEIVILCNSAGSQYRLGKGMPDVELVFGGYRKTCKGGKRVPLPEGEHALHACPAEDLAMGAMMGILAALLSAGRIQSLPASLIVEVSGWN